MVKNTYKDMADFIHKCQVRNMRKSRKKRAPLQEMSLAEYPFQTISIDTVGPMVETDPGNMWIVTVVDHFSSYPAAYAAPDKTADSVARVLLEHVIPTHTCPRVMISDNGTDFCERRDCTSYEIPEVPPYSDQSLPRTREWQDRTLSPIHVGCAG